MRSSIIFSAVVALVRAAPAPAPAPAPQDIDFDLAYAAPEPIYAVATGATAQIVTYDASSIYQSAVSQITATTDDSAPTATAAIEKRDAACAAQPMGHGPIPSPDTASAFAVFPSFAALASAAPVPIGYTQTYSNLNSSSNAYGYLGFVNLKTYDSAACAAQCNAVDGCIAVNLFFERDPSVDPGTGNSGCANPSSTATIKCVLWGGPVNAANALNYGQMRNQFQVLIAGSNGYVNKTIAGISGYNTAVPLGNAAINAPLNQYGYDTYLGSAIFVGRFDAQLCADACTQKSNYAIAHPPTDGSAVKTCQFFNTYILYINNTNHVQGQYCAMYSQSWPASYATNVGQYRGNDHFLIEYSFAYSNSTSPGSATDYCLRAVGTLSDAPFASSAASDCSSFLLKTSVPCVFTSTTSATVTVTASTVTSIRSTNVQVTQQTTQAATVTSTVSTIEDTLTVTSSIQVVATYTSYSTITSSVGPVVQKRDVVPDPLPAPFTLGANNTTLNKRVTSETCAVSIVSPSSIPTYASLCSNTARYSSACSQVGITAATTTLAASTSIVTLTSTVTITPSLTVTSIETDTVSVTTTSTTIIPETLTTTDATLVISNTYTSTQVFVVPTTKVVNYCNAYNFVATSGSYTGQYVTGDLPDPSRISYSIPSFTSDTTKALSYVFHADGSVYVNNVYVLAAEPGASYLYQVTSNSESYYAANYGFTPLYCSIQGVAPLANAAGSVSCTSQGKVFVLQTCPPNGNGAQPDYLLKYSEVGPGCVGVNLAAIFVGEVPC